MTDAEVLVALDDRRTLALTAYGEARATPRDDDSHSPIEGLVAVMIVVRNRRAKFARWQATDASYKAICLAPRQFSCWTPAGIDANHLALLQQARTLVASPSAPVADPVLRECLYLADGVIAGIVVDRTGNADSYFAPAAMVPPGRVPVWAVGRPRTLIADQYFLKVLV